MSTQRRNSKREGEERERKREIVSEIEQEKKRDSEREGGERGREGETDTVL